MKASFRLKHMGPPRVEYEHKDEILIQILIQMVSGKIKTVNKNVQQKINIVRVAAALFET